MRSNGLRALQAILAAATLSPWAAPGPAAGSTPTFSTERVTAVVRERVATHHVVGCAVAVVRHGVVVYARGFGVRDLVGRAPVTVDTPFEIGSDTKQFTAAAILQLSERGQLALDDRLATYVPEFPHAHELTLRQLLSQTTGLPEFMLTNHFVHIAETSGGTLARIERMASGPLHFVPGSRWEYSNTNYIALGRVIEVVSGESYETYLHRHLFRPAGMSRTTVIGRVARSDGMPTGYWHGLTRRGPLTPAPKLGASWTWSAGEIVSTVGDLAKWDAALEAGKIVSASDFALMTTPARLSDGTVDEYGFGWWTDPLLGHKRIYHDGDTFGMSSSNNLFPDDGLAVIVLANVGEDEAAKIAARIFKAIEQQ